MGHRQLSVLFRNVFHRFGCAGKVLGCVQEDGTSLFPVLFSQCGRHQPKSATVEIFRLQSHSDRHPKQLRRPRHDHARAQRSNRRHDEKTIEIFFLRLVLLFDVHLTHSEYAGRP